TEGNFLGGCIASDIKWVIYVDQQKYSELSQSERFTLAHLIGTINRKVDNRNAFPVMLVGPGRWGTTTPSLGVPVKYFEINNASVIVEIAVMREDLIPDVSYGTHFFQDIVESDTYYIALIPDKDGLNYNRSILDKYPDIASELLQGDAGFSDVLHVYDVNYAIRLIADINNQKLICFEHSD
ncbi:MAG TPA: phosphoenolpyruvate synthase, partial [Spirochaetota bacterium]|nr:phosphoenolpyruvate synthase [Spirochaetota bacterium]